MLILLKKKGRQTIGSRCLQRTHLKNIIFHLLIRKVSLTSLLMITLKPPINNLTNNLDVCGRRHCKNIIKVINQNVLTVFLTFPPAPIIILKLHNCISFSMLSCLSMENLVLRSHSCIHTTILHCLHMISSSFSRLFLCLSRA